jgi:hypothetical protein
MISDIRSSSQAGERALEILKGGPLKKEDLRGRPNYLALENIADIRRPCGGSAPANNSRM